MAKQTQAFTGSTTWTVPSKAYILDVFLVGGGGGGGFNGGGGGGGGRIVRSSGYTVTPGSTVSVTIGNGGGGGTSGSTTGGTGQSTVFGALTATGGNGGTGAGGTGGTSSINAYSSITNTTGGAGGSGGGGGGASPAGNGNAQSAGGGGANGYFFNNTWWAGGGGGGCPTFTQSTPRPFNGAPGGVGGGGAGGGDDNSGTGVAGSAGTANTGGGGGGGAAAGTSVRQTAGSFPSYTFSYTPKGGGNGGAGGSGYAFVTYDEAEFYLSVDGGVTEGSGSVTVNLRTRNVPNGATVGYALSGTNVTAADFSPATLTGNFTVSSTDGGQTGTASVTLTLAADTTTEAEEVVALNLNNGFATITFSVGDFSVTGFSQVNETVGNLVIGKSYTIATVGTTIWTALGASANTAGTTFTATGTGQVTAGSFVSGRSYTISSLGTTDFTTVGAASNTLGVTFTATGAGTGTGIAIQGNGTAYGLWIQKRIQTSDYNNIRTKVSNVMTSGNAGYGYGQTMLSSAVDESSRVTATGWANLRYDIINAWTHQYGSAPTLPVVTDGDLVKANTITAPYARYDSFANGLVANRFAVHSSQASTVAKTTDSTTWPGIYGNFWNNRVFNQVSVSWPSAAAARSFFNAGGEIRFNTSLTGGSANVQNNSWVSLLTGVGTVSFGGNKPEQGTEPNNGTNFYRLSNSSNIFYTATATNPYSTNKFRISARTPYVVDNSLGAAKEIEFLVEWLDDHQSVSGSFDQVDGTISLAVTTLEPTGILQPPGTGSFAVVSPTVVSTPISPLNTAIYTVTPSTTSVIEGASITFNITGSFLPNGTHTYSIVGTNVNANDFTDNLLSGSFAVASNTGSFSKTLSADITTEGIETFYVEIYYLGGLVATSPTVTIQDTSLNPPIPRVLTITSNQIWTVPASISGTVDVLLVGGGGGGGSGISGDFGGGGGGGAGGVVYQTGITLTPGDSHVVTIGQPGIGAGIGGNAGGSGTDTTFLTYTAFGGGGGAGAGSPGLSSTASGGGGSGNTTNGYQAPGSGGAQGNIGGEPLIEAGSPVIFGGGGGGGAGAGGQDSIVNNRGGNGGIGISNSITGSAVFYGGGGAGGAVSASTGTAIYGATGGNGGGGANYSNATFYGGGGGGGNDTLAAGNGFQGVVIIKGNW